METNSRSNGSHWGGGPDNRSVTLWRVDGKGMSLPLALYSTAFQLAIGNGWRPRVFHLATDFDLAQTFAGSEAHSSAIVVFGQVIESPDAWELAETIESAVQLDSGLSDAELKRIYGLCEFIRGGGFKLSSADYPGAESSVSDRDYDTGPGLGNAPGTLAISKSR